MTPCRDGRRLVVIVHPGTIADQRCLRDLVSRRARDRGWGELQWKQTTRSDPGSGMTSHALRQEPHLVLVCGGDGTVNAVAAALVHTGIPMGIVPAGTGNLLARNFGIPSGVDDAVVAALDGVDRRVDVGRLAGHLFVGMGGMGLDAVMVRDTPPRRKRLLGWPAYIPAAIKGLRSGASRTIIRIDDGPWLTRRVRAVITGNVGRLQGEVDLLPEADPADGLLDLVLLRDVDARGWLATTGRLLRSRQVDGPAVERFQFRRLEVRNRPARLFEVDGEVRGKARSLTIQVEPAALTMRMPA